MQPKYSEVFIRAKELLARPEGHEKFDNAADLNNRHPDGLQAVEQMFCRAIRIAPEEEEDA